jgi:hypothetical protein
MGTVKEQVDRLYREVCDLSDRECKVRRELRRLQGSCPHAARDEVVELADGPGAGPRQVVKVYCADCRLLLAERREYLP